MTQYKILHIGTSEYMKYNLFCSYFCFPEEDNSKLKIYTEVVVDSSQKANAVIDNYIKWAHKPICREEFDIIEVSDEQI